VYGAQRVPGHPVLLARGLWPRLEELRGDTGARELFAAHPEWLCEVEVDEEPPVDLDHFEDYLRELRRGEATR
jgi:CTP:molybdopterin cytidylyltransferase MocA